MSTSGRTLCASLLALSLAGCATPATKEDILMPQDGDWFETMSRSCQAQPDAELIARAAGRPDRADFLQRVILMENSIARHPLLPGNKVTLLIDGPVTHAAQLQAIEGARHHVHFNIYLFTDDRVGGDYAEHLIERARAGVQVRLLLDGVGSVTVAAEFLEKLREAGVEIHQYNPLDGAEIWRITRRNHHKILVVDGRVAFTGGINITDKYRSGSVRRVASAGSGAKPKSGWRDTHIKIEGPAVAEFQQVFFDVWEKEEGAIPKDDKYWPKLFPVGDEFVRPVRNRGNDLVTALLRPVAEALGRESKPGRAAIYASYVIAMTQAQHRIWITQAYFAPNQEFIDLLKQAARRGVDVQLLVPGKSDIAIVLHASRVHYSELLKAGVRIHEYEGPVLHAKTAVIDSVWSTVGSSNLDYRSFIHNDEANAIILGGGFATEMENMFRRDLERSEEIALARWKRRPLSQKLKERMAALVKWWL